MGAREGTSVAQMPAGQATDSNEFNEGNRRGWAQTGMDRLVVAWSAARLGLQVRVFGSWEARLDAVLRVLPESETCPHDLFRLLLQNPSAVPKRIVLVSERGEPVALVGLRYRLGYWEPVTQWLVPGMVFPVRAGYLARALAAVAPILHVAWWRWTFAPLAVLGRGAPIYSGISSQRATGKPRRADRKEMSEALA